MKISRAKQSVAAGLILIAAAVLWTAGQQVGPWRTRAAAQAANPTPVQRGAPAAGNRASVTLVSSQTPLYSIQPYPAEYDVLLTRSIFSRRGIATPSPDARGGASVDVSSTRPSASSSPESGLIFRAAMRQGDQFMAFVEDTYAGRTLRLTVGSPVGRGRVEQITLDRLSYQLGERRTSVQIGQNLEGSMASVATRPTTGPATPTVAPAADSGPPPSSAEQRILDELRRRREGGK